MKSAGGAGTDDFWRFAGCGDILPIDDAFAPLSDLGRHGLPVPARLRQSDCQAGRETGRFGNRAPTKGALDSRAMRRRILGFLHLVTLQAVALPANLHLVRCTSRDSLAVSVRPIPWDTLASPNRRPVRPAMATATLMQTPLRWRYLVATRRKSGSNGLAQKISAEAESRDATR